MTEADPTAIEFNHEPGDGEGTIRYLVSDARGQFVIEIPETWKITFGAVNPGTGSPGSYERGLHCLRVWAGKDKLRAVFCDVKGVRDLSLPLARKIDKETGSAEWTRDDLGNFEHSTSRKMLEPEILTGDDAW